jgi:HEAT repeat protein
VFGLGRAELALIVGGAGLGLRVLAGLAQVVYWYVADARRVSRYRAWVHLLVCASFVLLAFGLVWTVAGGWPGAARVVALAAAALAGFFAGLVFEFFIGIYLFRLSDRLMALRVPRYREQLLHGDETVRAHAARQLASLGRRAAPARPELLTLFGDGSAEVRAAATLAALATTGAGPESDPELARAARPLLTDPEPRVKVHAASILAECGAPAAEVLPALCEGVRHENADARAAACGAIRRLGPAASPALPVLREAVLAPGPTDYDALDALGKLGAPAVPTLTEVLERGDELAREMAADALADMGEPGRAALPALRKLAARSDTPAAGAARQAIKVLGGDLV